MINSEIVLSLIQKCISRSPLDEIVLTLDNLDCLYNLAKSHDVAHLLAEALKGYDFGALGEGGEELRAKLEKQRLLAVLRYEKLRFALEQLCELFEAEGIDHMPLKGSVLRRLYPEPWMRTSCDIDILVREEQLERAAELIIEKLGYKMDGGRNYHDISLISPAGVHLELHFSLLENAENLDRMLSRAWEFSNKCENSYKYEMTPEFFVFHMVAHSAYHFIRGGCGLRQYIDLKLILEKLPFDESLLISFCETSDILKFYEKMKKLTLVWFGDDKHDEVTQAMGEYILNAGVYGTLENTIAVSQSGGKSKLGYVMSRLFVPYSRLKEQYPVLRKHKWLFPLVQIRRWFRIFFKGKLRSSVKELQVNNSVSDEKKESVARILSQLELR